jgi:hypothetical protein
MLHMSPILLTLLVIFALAYGEPQPYHPGSNNRQGQGPSMHQVQQYNKEKLEMVSSDIGESSKDKNFQSVTHNLWKVQDLALKYMLFDRYREIPAINDLYKSGGDIKVLNQYQISVLWDIVSVEGYIETKFGDRKEISNREAWETLENDGWMEELTDEIVDRLDDVSYKLDPNPDPDYYEKRAADKKELEESMKFEGDTYYRDGEEEDAVENEWYSQEKSDAWKTDPDYQKMKDGLRMIEGEDEVKAE